MRFFVFLLLSISTSAAFAQSFETKGTVKASNDALSDLSVSLECNDALTKAEEKAEKKCISYGFQSVSNGKVVECKRSKMYGFYVGNTFVGHPGTYTVKFQFDCK